MPLETKKRFSFTEAAAQQPERQRFSFAQPKRKEIKDFFPATNMVADITALQPRKTTVSQKVSEFIAPPRGFSQEEIDATRDPSKFKNIKPLTALKWGGEMVTGLSELSSMAMRQVPGLRALAGKPEEYEKIKKWFEPSTAFEAGQMQDIDRITLFVGSVGKINKVKTTEEIVSATTAKTAREVASNLGIKKPSEQFLERIIKTGNGADAQKIVDELVDSAKGIKKAPLAPVVKEIPTPAPTVRKPFSFSEASKQVPPQTTIKTPAVIQDVAKAPVAPLRRTTPFSFVDEAAKQTPDVPTTPASPNTPAQALNLAKTPEEFISLVKQLPESKRNILPDLSDKGLTETFNLGKGVETAPNEIADSVLSFITPDGQKVFTPITKGELSKIKDEVAQIPASGPKVSQIHLDANPQTVLSTGGREINRAEFSKLHPQAQQVISKITDSNVPTPSKPAIKVAEQRIADVAETKKWTEAPAETQKITTQEVAKTYSGTDASKGFVTDAVNHIDNVPPIKNVTAKARNFAKAENTPIDLPPETLRGWLQTRIQDSAYRLGLVQKNIVATGKKISDEANAYLQREAYIGRASAKIGAFEKKLGMEAGNKNGLLMRMKKDGIDLTQLDEYMRAKAAKARNARVASKTDGKIADGGSGLTNKQADEILAKYGSNPTIAKYAKEFRETAIDAKMQVLKDAGIYTDEQIKLITQGEPDYVPFKVEEFSRVQGGGKGFSVQSTGVKGIKGSERTDRTNAVMQSAVDYEEAVIRAEKNKALQSLAKLIKENPDDTLWEIKGVTYTPQYDKYGEVVFLRKNPINERTSVEFFENGKAFEITFHDEALAKVFTEEGLTKPIPGLVKINNYLRAVNTVINPEFMITNAIRDLQTAIVTAGGEKGAVVASKMVKDYPAASKGIWQAVRNESNTGWAKVYNEMVENGGRTGWFDLKDVGETTKEVSARIARYNSTKTSDALMRSIDGVGKLISDANEVFEMSVRTSAYKQLVDGGMSKVAAANYAKNMTVNFNKRGNWGMTLNSAYLFANAGIQGSARLLMAMKNPKVRRITYGIAASSYGLNELNMKLNPEGYERLQDFEKERNLIVMLPVDGNKWDLPGISGDPANGYYLKMPLPYGFNVFKVGGDVAYDVVNGKKTNAEGMVQMLRAIDASFNPLSSGTPTQFITPTFLDPFVSHWENKNWFGAPIMPEQPAFAPAVRDSDRYFSGARDISVGTAQFLNRLTGGNEVTAGTVDISPETIDHVIDSIGGGLGNFIGQTVDGTINTVKGDIPTPDEMPFIRKLIDTPFETGEQSQVFELLEKSATSRMSAIEINRFIKNATRAIETGQIDDKTAKRVIKDFVANAARQEAGEVLSLVKEGKIEEAQKVIANAPPSISKELNKLIEDDVEREIKRLKRELEQ